MAQKDMTQKKLEDYVDVFADIFNILLIRCPENDIIPDKLFPGPTESIYKADNLNREQRRDTYKYYDLEGYGAGLHLKILRSWYKIIIFMFLILLISKMKL